MTDEEREAFMANIEKAAMAINPATAKVCACHVLVVDPYGIYDLPDEAKCVGREHFARAPGSKRWVAFSHLPQSVVDELWKRIERDDPDGPSLTDPDLPNVDRLVVEIMARDDGEPGYAAAVARGIMKAQSA
jgi:hypothetical protein